MAQITTSLIEAVARGSMTARAMLDRAMQEAIAGTIKPGRGGRFEWKKEGRSGGSTGRWKLHIDLRCPVSRPGRISAGDGSTSFHFATMTISHASAPSGGNKANRAAAHEAYLVGKVERGGREPQLGESYLIEPKSGEELETEHGRALVFLSSISDDLPSREVFWNARWQNARKAGAELLELVPANGAIDDWHALAVDENAPPKGRAAAMEIATALRITGVALKPSTIRVESEDLRRWATGLGDRFGRNKSDRMIHHRVPRGGAVQRRFELELPAELGLEEIEAVVADLAAPLKKAGIAFTMVVHAPDPHNDRRNLHAHLIAYTRRLPILASGDLDLLAPGIALRPGDLAAVFDPTLDPKNMHHSKLAAADLSVMRAYFAELCNGHLTDLGVERRFDPRSFAEMGIEKTPEVHLGSAAAVLLAAGVMTDIARDNAVRDWQAAGAERQRAVTDERAFHDERIARYDREGGTLPVADRTAVARLVARYCETACDLVRSTDALSKFDLDERMARSAAERLLRTTDRLLAAADSDRKVQRDARDIQARNRLARAHLAELDERLSVHRASVSKLRSHSAQQRALLASLETEIQTAIAQVRAQRQAASNWSRDTVLSPGLYPDRLPPAEHCTAIIGHLFGQTSANSDIDPERIVLVFRTPGDARRMEVSGLRSADAELMKDPRWKRRLEDAFSRACERQEQAVRRLLAHVEQHGRRSLERGQDRLRDQVNPTLFRLHTAYAQHPVYHAGLAAAETMYRKKIAGDNRLGLAASTTAQARPVALPPQAASPPVEPRLPPSSELPRLERGSSDAKMRTASKSAVANTPANVQEASPAAAARPVSPPAPVDRRDEIKHLLEALKPKAPASDKSVAAPAVDQAREGRRQADVTVVKPTGAEPGKSRGNVATGAVSPPQILPGKPVVVASNDAATTASSANDGAIEQRRTGDSEVRRDAVLRRAGTQAIIRAAADQRKAKSPNVSPPAPTTTVRSSTPSAGPDRTAAIRKLREYLDQWMNRPERTDDEVARGMLVQRAYRLAQAGELDAKFSSTANRLDVFIATDDAAEIVERLRNTERGRHALELLAKDALPLPDHLGMARIEVDLDEIDDGSLQTARRRGPERE